MTSLLELLQAQSGTTQRAHPSWKMSKAPGLSTGRHESCHMTPPGPSSYERKTRREEGMFYGSTVIAAINLYLSIPEPLTSLSFGCGRTCLYLQTVNSRYKT